jgi:hypothetical protein
MWKAYTVFLHRCWQEGCLRVPVNPWWPQALGLRRTSGVKRMVSGSLGMTGNRCQMASGPPPPYHPQASTPPHQLIQYFGHEVLGYLELKLIAFGVDAVMSRNLVFGWLTGYWFGSGARSKICRVDCGFLKLYHMPYVWRECVRHTFGFQRVLGSTKRKKR